jgi:hypothetical protein
MRVVISQTSDDGFVDDSLYLRLSDDAPASPDRGKTNVTRTIETTDESASPTAPILEP